ncbi:hypothetical protein [Francisella philomiragia]|uniref:hypothetical protein n=1 Tax=Francisella philomiragia TaxID=28110 RepID=UPI0005A57AAA|nr:hypothetical protein [Francisella philomiragia]AJI55677.1 hypothetical protein LA56_1369 [Francisella philomiragia]MBK2092716.1 hypothetical protein [Francisella philomiragia]MBK2252912.1 hypothetical protein [Francisella philomiragia]MBK2256950.1 hypothetical protein [Francisella philomiragia]MBK2269608.1 hypothetical protein [Francisella philomiragia]
MKYKLFLVTFITLFLNTSYATNILFLSYDYGDANAFKELMPELSNRKINYEIIAIGKSRDKFKDNLIKNVNCLREFDNDYLIKDRSNLISKNNIVCLKNSLKYKPDIIISGMSSGSLAAILNSFDDVKKVAYYDNFDPYPKNDPNYYTSSFINTLKNKSLDKLFIVAEKTKNSFKQKIDISTKDIIVVGNPSLIEWQKTNKKCPSKKSLIEYLNIDYKKNFIVFAGDTTEDYKESFYNFAEAIKNMPNYIAIVSYHPKTNGEFEKNIKNILDIKNMVIADTDSKNPSTICLSTLSNIFIVHKSSMGSQALSASKNVIFIAKNTYKNSAIDYGLADLVYFPKDIIKSIKKNYNKDTDDNFYITYGIPKDSIKSFINSILDTTK